MAPWQLQQSTVECRLGDIAAQADMEAVVDAANAPLRIGGIVAGAESRGNWNERRDAHYCCSRFDILESVSERRG